MLTKNQIIHNLYVGKNFNDCIRKMHPEHLRDDLKQEVITIVCGWDDDKIKKLHGDKALEFYVVRVILNLIQSSSSRFYKQFRQKHIEFDNHEVIDSHDKEDREIREQLEDIALEEINKLYWYDAELIRLYLKHGNFRAIEAETKIPFISCYKTIKKALAILKNKATEQMKKPKPIFNNTELRQIQNQTI